MDSAKSAKFLLPSPNFGRKPEESEPVAKPHYLTPSGMTLLPRDKQPPPMYGKRGASVPSKYLNQHRNRRPPRRGGPAHQPPAAPPAAPPVAECQFCEACDITLQSVDDLRRHRSQHERCPVDGCRYRGHPSVMDKHVTTLHTSGLFEKFKKLSTPEEIAAWREERRKKYPTLANVQMRQRAQEQRQKRGERLEANQSRFGKPADRKRTQQHPAAQRGTPPANGVPGGDAPKEKRFERRHNKRRHTQQRSDQKRSKPEAVETEEPAAPLDEAMCGGVRMFRGTSQLKNYKHVKAKDKVETNALTGLLGMYGSDDEHDDETDVEDDEEEAVQQDEERAAEDELVAVAEQPEAMCDETPHKEAILSYPITTVNEIIEDPQVETVQAAAQDSSDEPPDEAPITHTRDEPSIAVPQPSEAPTKAEPRERRSAVAPRKFQRRTGLDYRKARLHKQNTMLEKLLESDIRHERNVLLQCVRFVCENNFFGVGGSAAEKTEEVQ